MFNIVRSTTSSHATRNLSPTVPTGDRVIFILYDDLVRGVTSHLTQFHATYLTKYTGKYSTNIRTKVLGTTTVKILTGI